MLINVRLYKEFVRELNMYLPALTYVTGELACVAVIARAVISLSPV